MKKFSKILSVALLVALVLSLGVANAFAAGTDTITIGSSTKGSTYDAYKVFDVTYADTNSDGTNDAFAYTISSTNPFYQAVVNSGLFTLAQIGTTDVYNVTATTMTGEDAGSSPADASGTAGSVLAPALKAVVDAMTDAQKAAALAGTVTATADNQADLTITGLDHGYYFVTTTTGSLCSLDTTQPTVTIKDKNKQPTIDKTVEEDRNNETGNKKNDAEIGQTVKYTSVFKAEPGATNYVVHDKMTDGLTFTPGSVAIAGLTKDTHYTVNENPSDDCTFEISFTEDFYALITEEKTYTITYEAVVNSSAIIGVPSNSAYGAGNDNEIYLKFGETNETTHDWTRTYVWSVDVYKYYDNNGTSTPLAGAKFALSYDKIETAINSVSDVTHVLKWTQVEKVNGVDVTVPTYRLDANGNITEIETGETGKFQLIGLDEGKLYLYETYAPAGFNKMATGTEITITSPDVVGADRKTAQTVSNAATFTPVGTVSGANAVDIINNTGAVLPSTGGIGTTIFYVIGGVLVLAAIILLVTKKRMSD